MIIANLGLYGISYRKAKLFGSMEQFPLIAIRFLFFQLYLIKGDPIGLFREAIRGLSEDRDWLVKNARSIRLEKKKLRSKMLAKFEAEYRDRIKNAWDYANKSENAKGELQNEVYSLRRVIKGLTEEMP